MAPDHFPYPVSVQGAQRIIVYEDGSDETNIYGTTYRDEDYTLVTVELCKQRHPEARDVRVLNADAFPPEKLKPTG